MIQTFITILCLFFATPVFGAISYDTGDEENDSAPLYIEAFLSSVANATCVAVVNLTQGGGALTVLEITDESSSTWTFAAGVTTGAPATRVEIWYRLRMVADGDNVFLTPSAQIGSSALDVQCYLGVDSIGISDTATGSGTAPSISLTTQDANNFVVSGFGFAATEAAAFTADVGNLRHNYDGNGAGNAGIGVVDNTAASASSVTTSATLSSSQVWGAVALELRSTSTPATGRRRVTPVFFP